MAPASYVQNGFAVTDHRQCQLYKSHVNSDYHIRPYLLENSGSRPLSQDNLVRGRLVAGSVTTSEYRLLYVFFTLSAHLFAVLQAMASTLVQICVSDYLSGVLNEACLSIVAAAYTERAESYTWKLQCKCRTMFLIKTQTVREIIIVRD
jgi:hypothetical protein